MPARLPRQAENPLAEFMAAEGPSGGFAGAAGAVPADLAKILDLTRQMLEKARAGEWDDLIALESMRRPIITRHFDPACHAHFDVADAEGIQELRDLNDHILEIGRVRSRELVKILTDSGRQRRAVDHYRRAGRG
jgi:hypothetical protein